MADRIEALIPTSANRNRSNGGSQKTLTIRKPRSNIKVRMAR